MLTRTTGNTGGNFADVAALVAAGSPDGRVLYLQNGATYQTTQADPGGGVLLSSGNYATIQPEFYDNSTSGLTATNMQAAIDEILTMLNSSFVTKFTSPVIVVAAGATGTYATIPCPAGQRIVLTQLGAVTTTQTNLTTVTVGGVDVVSAAVLRRIDQVALTAGNVVIGGSGPNQEPIVGDIDEDFELKTDVATSSDTVYSYQFQAPAA